jgi:uncharacterized cupin superfamily protein
MHLVNLDALPEIEQRSPSGKFHSFSRNVSLALGGIANTGTWGGGHPFDVQIRRIPPGAAVCTYHLHLAQWEYFVVRRGEATVRAPDGSFAASTGEVFFHPPGSPHQLINNGTTDLEVMIVTDQPPLDSCFYPDSDKRSLRPPGKFFRVTEVHYFDGEDELPPDVAPYKAPSPALPSAAPFPKRKLKLDDLPWEAWESPGKKFRGESKEVSIALGAQRHTPVGLGGHPFDIELSRLLPGRTACPFHSHAAEWEMFIIVSGTATVRAGTATHTLRAGDVILHPPGEPHQITNASNTEDLLFYLIADNAPVEYCHYPDSQKWVFRTPRKSFRATDVDYWADEE